MDNTFPTPKFINDKPLTLVGLRGNQDNQSMLFDEIGRKHNQIRHIALPYGCQVVWSIDKQKSLYDTFIGCVVDVLEEVPPDLQVHQIPEKNYVAFEFSGTGPSYIIFLKAVHYQWFPHSGFEFDDSDFSHIHFHKTTPIDLDPSLPEEQRLYNWEVWFPIIS